MRVWSRVLVFLVVALAAFWFTVANAAERVSVDLVVFRVATSLPLLVFGAMLIGMLAVILVGLRADLRTRRALQQLRELGGTPPRSAEGAGASRSGEPSAVEPSAADPSAADPTAVP